MIQLPVLEPPGTEFGAHNHDYVKCDNKPRTR